MWLCIVVSASSLAKIALRMDRHNKEAFAIKNIALLYTVCRILFPFRVSGNNNRRQVTAAWEATSVNGKFFLYISVLGGRFQMSVQLRNILRRAKHVSISDHTVRRSPKSPEFRLDSLQPALFSPGCIGLPDCSYHYSLKIEFNNIPFYIYESPFSI